MNYKFPGLAANRDDEDSPLDSKLEINNKQEEENKRKLTSMLKEYEWDKKDESQEKEANCPKDVESGKCLFYYLRKKIKER